MDGLGWDGHVDKIFSFLGFWNSTLNTCMSNHPTTGLQLFNIFSLNLQSWLSCQIAHCIECGSLSGSVSKNQKSRSWLLSPWRSVSLVLCGNPLSWATGKPLDANAVSLLTNFIHFSNICVCGCRDDSALHLYNMTLSEELHCFTRPAPYSPSPQHCLPGHEADRADNTNFTD